MKLDDYWYTDKEHEYEVGYDHGVTGYPFTKFWKNPTESQEEMNNEYRRGYKAGQAKRLKNLLTKR